jgi:DNA-binding CsgD family transcriptional regulator
VATVFGRRDERRRIDDFVTRVGNEPVTLVVEGDPGIGKTALFDYLLSRLPATARPLVARCVPADATSSYVGLGDLVGAVDQAGFAALPAPQRHALEVILHRADPGSAIVTPALAGRAVTALIGTAAAGAPLLLAVDDVQWLDPASAGILAFALHRLRDLPLGVLVTCRTDTAPQWLEDSRPTQGRSRFTVGPLDAADLTELVEQRLGRPLTRAVRRQLARDAAGNPLLALELAERQDHGGDIPPMPARLEGLVTERLRRLPAAALEPLGAAACLAAPTVAQVTAALGRPAGGWLDRALDQGLIKISEGRIQFRHPMYALAARAAVPPSVRRNLHAKLAAVVDDEEERADHLVRAADGPDGAVAEAAERGADVARARGAPEIAAGLAEAAVRLTPPADDPDRRRRLVAAAYHRAATGDTGAGRAHLRTAVHGVPGGAARAELTWRLAMLTFLEGDLPEAVGLLEQALVDSSGSPALHATVSIKLAGMLWWQGRLREALDHGRTALAGAELTNDPVVLVDSLMLHLRTATAAAVDNPPALARRLELAAQAAGARAPHDQAELALAGLNLIRGDHRAAADKVRQLYQRAVDEGDEIGVVQIAAHLAEIRLMLGEVGTARLLAREALRNARRVASPSALEPARYAMAVVDAYTDGTDAAEEALGQLHASCDRQGKVMVGLMARALRGVVRLTRGDAAAAHRDLGAVIDALQEIGVREPAYLPAVWSDLDALVQLGELDAASDLAQHLHERGLALDRPYALATAARARAVVAAARGDLAGAQPLLEEALRHHERYLWPLDRARTLLALGGVLRRAKRKSAARAILREALAEFDRVGAVPWAAKATAELSRIGGRAPVDGLTPAERQVAGLVASGRSNAEVAAAMFLSAKTVAHHLTRVYAKLGVRNRAELTRFLGNSGG